MSCGSEYEDRNQKERNAGLMEAWSHAQYAGETERERETQKPLLQKMLLVNVHMCVFNAHFYTSPLED